MITSNTMSTGIYLFIHSRRPNRNRISQFISRHCFTRHLLRSSPFPLCLVNRSCIRHYCSFCSLIPTIYRIYSKLHMSKNPLRHYVCRSKHNIFPPTFSRFIRNTTTLLRLPRCLYNVKHSILYGVIHFTNSCSTNSIYNLRSICL